MTAELFRIVSHYAAFERAVSRHMSLICKQFCSICREVCCGLEYCRETTVSPFLKSLISGARPAKVFCPEQGWLTSAGCALTVGRPPVCYQFSCNKIVNALPDEHCRYHFQVLSELVPYIGKRALGSRHLVEITDLRRLLQVKFERFDKRLRQAWNALNAIRCLNGADHPVASKLADLSRIIPVSVSYIKLHHCNFSPQRPQSDAEFV